MPLLLITVEGACTSRVAVCADLHLMQLYLEPVNGAAVDKGRVLAQAVPEGIADGAETQHHMQALLALLHKVTPHFHCALQPKLASSWSHHLQHLMQTNSHISAVMTYSLKLQVPLTQCPHKGSQMV